MTECPGRDTLQQYLGDALSRTANDAVKDHICGCPPCRALLEELAPSTPFSDIVGLLVAAKQTTPDSVDVSAEGSPFGPLRFTVGAELGSGGMAVVYKVHDPALGRAIALKTLRADRRTPKLERRFVEEAQVASQLQHPAIPPIHEIGMLPDGRPYFTMKIVKGQTLAALLAERPSPEHDLPRFVGIFEQVCQGIAFAHSKRVLHRDLKPANVMVGAFGEVQVMDWGLAKVLPADVAATPGCEADKDTESDVRTDRSHQSDSASLTGDILGTPAYMSPEQARGEVERLDRRSDVFALGAILCEILTGRRVYEVKGLALLAVAAAGEVGPALERLTASTADEELKALARACLCPEPDGRPPDGSALAATLAAYRADVAERRRKQDLEWAAEAARAEEKRAREQQRRRSRRALSALAIAATGALVAVLWIGNRNLARVNADLLAQQQRTLDAEQRADEVAARENEAQFAANEERRKREETEHQAGEQNAKANLLEYLAQIQTARAALAKNDWGFALEQLRKTRPELRGWEYRHLQIFVGINTRTSGDWVGDINDLEFSPDERYLAVAGSLGGTALLDAATGRAARKLQDNADPCRSCTFLPNGFLASSDEQGTLRIWNPQTGEVTKSTPEDRQGPFLLTQSRDAERLAGLSVGSNDGIRIWHTATGRELRSLKGQTREALSLHVDSEGKRLVTGGSDRVVRLWNAETGQEIRSLVGHNDGVRDACFSPDGLLVASASYDNSARIWDAEQGKVLHTLEHPRPVFGVCFHPNGKRLATAGVDGVVRLWDVRWGKLVLELPFDGKELRKVRFSPRGSLLAAAGRDNGVRIWADRDLSELRDRREEWLPSYSSPFTPTAPIRPQIGKMIGD